MSPHETLFLESTQTVDIRQVSNNNLVKFQTWDFAGNLNYKHDVIYNGKPITFDQIFTNCSTLVYVIDCQESHYENALSKLVETISVAHSYNPKIHFEIFLQKVDGDFISDEARSERHQVSVIMPLYLTDSYSSPRL